MSKFKFAVSIILIFLSQAAQAKLQINEVISSKNTPDEQFVIGVGEYIITPSETEIEGIQAARGLAKIDAANKVGQYVEEVQLVSTETGETKKYLSVVSAASLKFETIEETVTRQDGQTKARVVIEASYVKEDLKASLDRFLENTDLHEKVDELLSKIGSQSRDLERRKSLIEQYKQKVSELNSIVNKSDAHKGSLRKKVESLESEIAILSSQYRRSMPSLWVAVETIAVSENEIFPENYKSKRVKYQVRKERLKNEYLNKLNDLINGIQSESYLFVDPSSDNPVGYAVFKWLVLEEDVYKVYGIDRINPSDIKQVTGFEGGAVSFKLGSDMLSKIMMSYSVYQVMSIGDVKYEMPLISPVKTDSFSESSSEHCYSGKPLELEAINTALCLQFSLTRYSKSHKKTIMSKSGKFAFDNIEHDDKNKVKIYFEVRES